MLIAGLQILYDRALQGQHWPGPPLDVTPTGKPAAHDILSRLDVVPTGGDGRGLETRGPEIRNTVL